MGCAIAVAWHAGAPRSSRRFRAGRPTPRRLPPHAAARHHSCENAVPIFYTKLVLTSVMAAFIFLDIDRPKAGPTSNGRTIHVP